jgi:hypothetical protein
MRLYQLKSTINSGKFPKDHPHFGGANLIITDDPNRKHHQWDIVIQTVHAGALSWLVVELKNIFEDSLNYRNKFDFYPYIGKLIQESVKANDDLFETMLYIVEKLEDEWEK